MKKNQVQKTLPQGSPKQNTRGCRARQREGQESTYKNVLKIRAKKWFYVSLLQLAPCFVLLLHRNGATSAGLSGRSSSASHVAGSKSSQSRPSPPPVFSPSIWKKHYSIFTSKSWLVWFVSLEPSTKEATFSCYCHSVYL